MALPRPFILEHEDQTGSGPGRMAEGVRFTDGRVALRWRTGVPFTAVYDSIEDAARAAQDRAGRTRIVFVDDGRVRG